MTEIKDGLLIDAKISSKIIPNIERPGLDFKKIRALIIHQTDSSNASGTIGWWQRSPLKAGAHFIVDRGLGTFKETIKISERPAVYKYKGTDGNYTGIDGKLYQTAHVNKRCNHAGKLRNAAYPDNYDSIGIEFVGKYDEVAQLYPGPSPGQIVSGAWLVKTLIELITTIPGMDAVYAHGVIAFKTPDQTEGGSTLEKVREELQKEIKVVSECTELLNILFPTICKAMKKN